MTRLGALARPAPGETPHAPGHPPGRGPGRAGVAAPPLAPPARVSEAQAQATHAFRIAALIGFAALHVPLGIQMDRVPAIAEFHAIATLGIGLLLALGKRLERIAYAVAYIAGAEVLWRMTHAAPFWEYGKYATAAVILLTLARLRPLRLPVLPFTYFALLMPSAVVVLLEHGFASSRRHLSFNMSGPFSLMLCVWLFDVVKLTPARLRVLILSFLSPVLAMSAVIVYGIVTADGISFNTESNEVTSGGFGPNQVSTVLGLGALLAFTIGANRKAQGAVRIAMLGIAIVLATQSALTFSRGGLLAAAAAAAVLLLLAVRDVRTSRSLVLSMLLIVLVGTYVVLPRLDTFTGGTLSARFEDVDLAHRDDIARDELRLFVENPLLGVGPGDYRRRDGQPAHTELTRMLAQHGSTGLFALLVLLGLALQRVRRARDPVSRGTAAALLTWSFLTMLHAAMRTVAPSFVFGLAFAHFRATEEPERASGGEPEDSPPLTGEEADVASPSEDASEDASEVDQDPTSTTT